MVEGDFTLSHYVVPLSDWKDRFACIKGRNESVLPNFNGYFICVGMVAM